MEHSIIVVLSVHALQRVKERLIGDENVSDGEAVRMADMLLRRGELTPNKRDPVFWELRFAGEQLGFVVSRYTPHHYAAITFAPTNNYSEVMTNVEVAYKQMPTHWIMRCSMCGGKQSCSCNIRSW